MRRHATISHSPRELSLNGHIPHYSSKHCAIGTKTTQRPEQQKIFGEVAFHKIVNSATILTSMKPVTHRG